jgi:hypothetical protein
MAKMPAGFAAMIAKKKKVVAKAKPAKGATPKGMPPKGMPMKKKGC